MEILKCTSNDKKVRYLLTMSSSNKKMNEAVGMTLKVKEYAIYTDEALDKDTEEMKSRKLVSIMDEDGSIYTAMSATFIKTFESILEVFGDELPDIEVISARSNRGRQYIDCTIVI